METLPYAAANPPVVVMIPTSDLYVPDWNPRKVIIPLDLANLVAFMKAGGKPPRITVWIGDNKSTLAIIEGQMRFLAAQQLGQTHMEAEVVDCTLDAAMERALTSNNQNKPFWLDTDLAIEARYKELKPRGVSMEALAGKLGKSETSVNNAIKIAGVLTPAAKELIYQNLQKTLKNDPQILRTKNKGFLITQYHLQALADLGDPAQVENALREVLDEYLTEPQVKGLVSHIKAGGDPAQFDPAKKPIKVSTAHEGSKPTSDTKATQTSSNQRPQALASRPQAEMHGLDVPDHMVKGSGAEDHGVSGPPPQKGIGLKPTILKWVGKGLLHAIGWCWGQFWKVLKDSIKTIFNEIGKLLGKTGRLVVRIALIILLIWVIWTYLVHPSHLYARGKALVDEVLTIFHSEKANPAPTLPPAPVAPPVAPIKVEPKPKAKIQKPIANVPVAPAPMTKSQPLTAWTSDEEPLEAYQDELSLIPAPCLIKEFQVTPDAEMGVDMATRRVNDLQDVERYSTFIGRDRHKVVSATPNPTGLTLAFDGGVNLGALAGALSGGLVGGASNNGLEIYWEDLKGIHCNKIQTLSDNLKAIYQLAFVVPGMKKPFIIQCSSADDCERLVSALQFWVRTAKKGINAPMSGLPYVNQGVLLGDGNKVDVTWVGSPIDKSGLITGDHIWGVDQNPASQPGENEIQTALQNLPSGNHTFYAINPSEWNKWKGSLNTRRGNPYHAKLEKLTLVVP